VTAREWAYSITDPPCKHGGRDCPKSECVDCIMEVVAAIQHAAYEDAAKVAETHVDGRMRGMVGDHIAAAIRARGKG
jgi:hypothetical protein